MFNWILMGIATLLRSALMCTSKSLFLAHLSCIMHLQASHLCSEIWSVEQTKIRCGQRPPKSIKVLQGRKKKRATKNDKWCHDQFLQAAYNCPKIWARNLLSHHSVPVCISRMYQCIYIYIYQWYISLSLHPGVSLHLCYLCPGMYVYTCTIEII